MTIKYVVGNLITAAQNGEVDVIAQQLNCFNTRKSGIAPQIDKAFPDMGHVDDATDKGCKRKLGGNVLGVEPCGLMVFGLYGQFGWWGRKKGERDTDYEALRTSFNQTEFMLNLHRDTETCKIGLPLLGCGLAQGDWTVVSRIIEEELCSKGWDVTVYVLNEEDIPEEV